jgi:glycosyltransferase involved in cell wall biosynthesis
MRVHVIDPSAYTPPYDHALCRALGEAGAQVDLFTSRFAYGRVADPVSYKRHEFFYHSSHSKPVTTGRSRVSLALKLAEHVPNMLRYRRAAQGAEIAHFQWLTVQQLDRWLLPHGCPLVLTAHDIMPREPRPGQLAAQRHLYERFDAIVVHSEHGRGRLVDELGVDPGRVHVIAHGAFTHLAERGQQDDCPPEFQTDGPVVLCFGLMRPYKGIEVLLQAWRGIADAELWIVGMPRMDISSLRADAPAGVRFVPRFIDEDELPAYFKRADLVVLPYLQADQSGVLFTALAFGKPLLLSNVGGFPEITESGAARVVPAGDANALRQALRELLGGRALLEDMGEKATAAALGRYSWDAVAREHIELYEGLMAQSQRR